MAEFQKVMRHKVRMCRQAVTCEKCPMFKEFGGRNPYLLPREQCHAFVGRHPDKAEPIIMDWAAEHPEKTMKDVFFEKFPQAKRNPDDGTPLHACPSYFGWSDNSEECSGRDCIDCWNRPAPEE